MTEQGKQILETKDTILEHWKQLPVEHQSSLMLVLIKDILQTEYGQWLVEALPIVVSYYDVGKKDSDK